MQTNAILHSLPKPLARKLVGLARTQGLPTEQIAIELLTEAVHKRTRRAGRWTAKNFKHGTFNTTPKRISELRLLILQGAVENYTKEEAAQCAKHAILELWSVENELDKYEDKAELAIEYMRRKSSKNQGAVNN